MFKKRLLTLGSSLLLLFNLQVAHTKSVSNVENNYFTTEDIVVDILFPSIDKVVIEKHGSEDAFGWELERIVEINYNENHSYDISMRIKIDIKDQLHKYSEDLIKARIYPSCNSEKIECDHDFKIEILDYKHLTQ